MTKQEFIKTHRVLMPADLFSTNDVLMCVAANLSDYQIERQFMTDEQIDEKFNNLKRYIFDYMDVLRTEERSKYEQEAELEEFRSHLGKFNQ